MQQAWFLITQRCFNCAMFGWTNDPVVVNKLGFSSHQFIFTSCLYYLSLEKDLNKLVFTPGCFKFKFSWSWPNGSGEENENMKSLDIDRSPRAMNNRWSEKLITLVDLINEFIKIFCLIQIQSNSDILEKKQQFCQTSPMSHIAHLRNLEFKSMNTFEQSSDYWYHKIGQVVLEEKIFKFCRCIFAILLSPFGKGDCP